LRSEQRRSSTASPSIKDFCDPGAETAENQLKMIFPDELNRASLADEDAIRRSMIAFANDLAGRGGEVFWRPMKARH
jgi:hypothetical protein